MKKPREEIGTAVTDSSRINATMVKFGYPETLVMEPSRWVILIRPEQVTLGSLVLVCKDDAGAFSEISAEAFSELAVATKGLESCLSELWGYRKINYLMLMMVDRDVHFHVIPRYDGDLTFEGKTFSDTGWPGTPDLANATTLEGESLTSLGSHLRRHWPA